jgi:hypothetical protein
MNYEAFDNPNGFIQLFSITDKSAYSKPEILSNRKVGFSVQRSYPEKIRFKSPKTKDNKDDVVALIHVVYTHPSESRETLDPKKVPLIIRIGPYSRYLANHFDYDFEDSECPTEESVSQSKSTPRPIALDFLNEFFFNHERNLFLDDKNNLLPGVEVLDKVFEEHCNTIHWRKGLRLRSRTKTKSLLIAIISWVINLLPVILKKLFGRTIEEDDKSLRSVLEGYKISDLKKLTTDSLNIFGYKASRSVIITFCFFVCLVYLLQYILHLWPRYVEAVFSNNFLAITHAILVLWVLDVIIPRLLFHLMNALIKIRMKVLYSY